MAVLLMRITIKIPGEMVKMVTHLKPGERTAQEQARATLALKMGKAMEPPAPAGYLRALWWLGRRRLPPG